jgi:hypothetical protein
MVEADQEMTWQAHWCHDYLIKAFERPWCASFGPEEAFNRDLKDLRQVRLVGWVVEIGGNPGRELDCPAHCRGKTQRISMMNSRYIKAFEYL